MLITNQEELENIIGEAMSRVVSIVIQNLLIENEGFVMQDVYGYPTGSFYERTGEFLHAFSETYGDGSGIASGALDYDPSKITTTTPPQHASVVDGESSTDDLADIIYQGNGGIWHMPPRNAYKDLNKWLTKTVMRGLFESAMNQAGVPYKRSTGGIEKEEHDKL